MKFLSQKRLYNTVDSVEVFKNFTCSKLTFFLNFSNTFLGDFSREFLFQYHVERIIRNDEKLTTKSKSDTTFWQNQEKQQKRERIFGNFENLRIYFTLYVNILEFHVFFSLSQVNVFLPPTFTGNLILSILKKSTTTRWKVWLWVSACGGPSNSTYDDDKSRCFEFWFE